MKTILFTLLFTMLTLITFTACATEKAEPKTEVENSNRFRTVTTTNTTSQRVGSQTVVCHNCTAEFKLSDKIQKMSMKGDAVVDCPVCHHNYLKKSTK